MVNVIFLHSVLVFALPESEVVWKILLGYELRQINLNVESLIVAFDFSDDWGGIHMLLNRVHNFGCNESWQVLDEFTSSDQLINPSTQQRLVNITGRGGAVYIYIEDLVSFRSMAVVVFMYSKPSRVCPCKS